MIIMVIFIIVCGILDTGYWICGLMMILGTLGMYDDGRRDSPRAAGDGWG
jgi:hypothetical protein